ncbi:MAG TPA: NUDIX domain-containing protein [Candidatus Saccharimonadales bacterium]|nr:NUDIX domain-containing protein [Candidatus Saccharimonadales bacterium]
MADELVDIVDESGRVLRQVLKTQAHADGSLHKTVIGCLRNGDTWYLVKQASDRQDAGQLVNPVGGHVQADESDVDALLRECEEEIGTRNITYTEIGRARFHRQVIGRDENHLFIVYELWTDDPIVLNHEAESIHGFKADDLKQKIATQPTLFGDAYYFVLENFYPEFLSPAWVFRFKQGKQY